MKVICKFSCYDKVCGQSRTTYRIVQGSNNLNEPVYWIEQHSLHANSWFKTFRSFVHWKTLKELWNSSEFKSLFGQLSNC